MSRRITRFNWLCFGLVLAAAIFFRFYRLTDVPPGLVGDAAINGSDAWRLLHRGGHTLFLTNNGGRESTLIYLQALSSLVFGTTPLAVRLPTALIDTLTVAVTFWFVRWFFRKLPGLQPERMAFWAGLTMAVAYWPVMVSRLGFRAVLVPLVAVPFFWCYLLGRDQRQLKWFGLAGLFLGLGGYTYSAWTVLPLTLILAVTVDLVWPGQRERRRKLLELIVTLITAFIVYLPMLRYTVVQPHPLAARPATVGIWNYAETTAQLVQALWANLIATLGFFCCQGNEQLLLFGLPGRPGFDLGSGLLLLIGIGVSLKGFSQFRARLPLIWFLTGLLPGILSTEAPHPLRLIAAAPAAILLIAQGIDWLVHSWRGFGPLITGWLIIAALLTYRDYFVRWLTLPETAARFGQPMVELAETLEARVRVGEIIYLPQALYATPTLRFYLAGSFPPTAVDSFEETADQVTVWADSPAQTWVRLSPGESLMLPPQTGEPNLSESTRIATMDLRVLDWQQPVQLVDYKIGPAILYGAAFPRLLVPDQPLPVTLFWQAEAISREDYQVIVQLLDDRGQVWSLNEGEQAVHGAYPTSYWQPNVDRIADHHELQLKDELPVGRYRLAVALFDVARNIRLPVSPAGAAPDTAFLGPLKVAPTFDLTQGPAVDVATTFEGVADLQGYTLEAESLTVGQPLNIDLWWQTTAAVEVDYTVFVHLLDKAGQRVAGQDSQPVGGTYPTTLWDPGERVVDHHTVDTSTVPPGRYRLAVGLYEGISGVRVPVTGQPDSMMILPTSIEIGTE